MFFFSFFFFFCCANMLVSIPIYHAKPVRSSVRFIGQTVVLHGWGCREQRCVVFVSLRQVLVTWLYTSSVIVSLLLTQMIRVKPENGTRFVTLGGEGGRGGSSNCGSSLNGFILGDGEGIVLKGSLICPALIHHPVGPKTFSF